jgi:hypothetical protein
MRGNAQAPANGAARQLGVDAALHRLDDVVERQGEAAAQLDDQAFFPFGHRGGQAMWTGRSIDHVLTVFPARATVRLWMPNSRASALVEAVLFWM